MMSWRLELAILLLVVTAATVTVTVHSFSPREAAHIGKAPPAATTLLEPEVRPELQRRVEDGQHYDHFHLMRASRNPSWCQAMGDDDDMTMRRVQGVFCGYRTTPEEYQRLRSAHVVMEE